MIKQISRSRNPSGNEFPVVLEGKTPFSDVWAAESVWVGLRVNLHHHLPVLARPAGQGQQQEVLALLGLEPVVLGLGLAPQRALEVERALRVPQEPLALQAQMVLQALAQQVPKGRVAIEISVPRLLLRARRQLRSEVVAVPLSERVERRADCWVQARALKGPLELAHRFFSEHFGCWEHWHCWKHWHCSKTGAPIVEPSRVQCVPLSARANCSS